MKIPVFHDDQHGTAIVAAAAVLNGLKIVGKDIAQVKLVCSGAGAAAIACLDLQVSLGLKKENIFVCDSKGMIANHRADKLDADKQRYVQHTDATTLGDVIVDADVFLGLSSAGVLKPEMVARMAPQPIILAMANPDPEIRPEDAKAVRPDCLIGTGRSDYPNQVNNSLCFPFIFRGALDCGASTINEAMKLAAVHALAALAQAEPSDVVAEAYGSATPAFGPDYLIPRAFDPRLITVMSPALAQAAMESGVATRPIPDLDAYRERLSGFVYHSGMIMGPVFAAAKKAGKRVVYAEGEDERVLRAAQIAVDEKLTRPLLVGRADIIASRIARLGLRIRPGEDCEIVNILDDPRFREYYTAYYELTKRRGISLAQAQEETRTRSTLVAALLVRLGAADAMLCGTTGLFASHLHYVRHVIGLQPGAETLAVMQMLILQDRQLHLRHARQSRPRREADRRDDAAGRPRRAATRRDPERGDGLAFELRHVGGAVRAEDARRAGACARIRSRVDDRRRDARGCRVVQGRACSRLSRLGPDVGREPAYHAERRRGQHHVQRAARHGGRWRDRRRHPPRRGATGPHPDAVVDGSTDRQHGACFGRGSTGAGDARRVEAFASRRHLAVTFRLPTRRS